MQKRAQEDMWLLVGYEVLLGVSQLMHISIHSTLIFFFHTYKDTASLWKFERVQAIRLCVYKEIIINQMSIIRLD